MDSGKGNSGCSEGMIFFDDDICPTIRSRPDHIKLIITDEIIKKTLKYSTSKYGENRPN